MMTQTQNYKWTVLLLTFFEGFSWSLSTSIVSPLLPIIMQEFSLSYFEAGIVTTSTMVIYCAVQYPVGILADKFGRKRIMIFGLTWSAAICILTPFATTYPQLLVLLAIMGVGNGMHFIPGSTLISDYFETQTRGRALSINGSSGSAAMLVAPIVAVPVAVAFGWRTMFYVCAATMIAAAILFGKIVKEPKSSAPVEHPQSGGALRPPVVKLALAVHIMGYAGPVAAFVPLYLVKRFDMSVYNAALFYAIIPLATLVLSLSTVGGRVVERLKDRAGIIVATIITFATTLVLAATINIPLLVFALVSNGFNMAVANPTILSYAYKITSAEHRVAEMGFINTLWVLSGVVSPTLIGALVDFSSFEIAFTVIAFVAVSALIFVATMPRTEQATE